MTNINFTILFILIFFARLCSSFGIVYKMEEIVVLVGFIFMSIFAISSRDLIILFLNFVYCVVLFPHLYVLFLIRSVGSLIVGSFYLFSSSAIRDFIAFSSLTSTGFLLLVWTSFGEFVVVTSLFYILTFGMSCL